MTASLLSRTPFVGALALAVVWVSAVSAQAEAPSGDSRKRIAVIGVRQSETENDGSSRAGIGFGMNQLVAESLFDSGRFRLIEAKNTGKQQYLDDLVVSYGLENRPEYTTGELASALAELGTDYLSYGSVSFSRVSRSRIQIGPFGGYKKTLLVEVSVCLYRRAMLEALCSEGEGSAKETGKGAILTVKRDLEKGDLEKFKKGSAGIATTEAVHNAVEKLIESSGSIL